MATQVYVQLPDDSGNTGKKEDHVQVTPSNNYREVVTIGGPSADDSYAPVHSTDGLKVNLGADNDVTIANGSDVALGATTDTAVTGDVAGTVSAKLRGLNKILADVWDSTNHWLKVSIQNTTIAVTQSGSWVLSAGSAIIGKVSIDQTTPGTTNGVQVNAALPAGSNVIGHVITDSGSVAAVTAVGTIADDSTTPGAPVMVGGQAKAPDGTDPGNVSTEDDVVRWIGSLQRIQYVETRNPSTVTVNKNGSTAYSNESIASAPGAGFAIIVDNVIGSTGAATALNFYLDDSDGNKILGPIYLEAVAGRGFCSGPIRKRLVANKALRLTSSANIAQSFDIEYHTEKV